MKVVVTKCDANGNVDVEDIRRAAEKHSANLAAIMMTYPSTHGVFEEDVVEICEIVHQHGGQVYTDGANMNALVGVAKPGQVGLGCLAPQPAQDLLHPARRRRPGRGPVRGEAHLAPFLPSVQRDGSAPRRRTVTPVECRHLRQRQHPADQLDVHRDDGRRRPAQGHPGRAAQRATTSPRGWRRIYETLYTGRNGLVAHECILDLRPIKDATGHQRRGRGQAPDRLRLPCADAELPGRRAR